MNDQDEKKIGLTSAIRALTDEEFQAAIEAGQAIGVGAMLMQRWKKLPRRMPRNWLIVSKPHMPKNTFQAL